MNNNFDYLFYFHFYSDVKKIPNINPNILYNHYLKVGSKENRFQNKYIFLNEYQFKKYKTRDDQFVQMENLLLDKTLSNIDNASLTDPSDA